MTSRYLRAWLVLLVCLLLTGYAGYAIKSVIEAEAQRQFTFDCDEIQLKIAARMEAHKQVLLGSAALLDASDGVERNMWRAYAGRMQIDRHFNGIQGLGFSLLIPRQQLDSHIAAIRTQGFPEYTVRPAGARDMYSSIIYLEPFAGRNLRAFGYDMYSEPVRRAAMQQARDENTAVLSDKVVLVQETEQDVQAGTLMYLPVYRKSMPIETVAQRRAALYGWVYSPFRMSDLLNGVLQGRDNPAVPHVHLQVYDGRGASTDNLLYDCEAGQKTHKSALFALERHMSLLGNEWTLRFARAEGDTSGIDYSKAWMTLAGGSSMSLLLFLLMLSYVDNRRAEQELEAAHRELQTAYDSIVRKNAELQENNRARSEFLNAMSHELKTPLNHIIGFSELLKEGCTGQLTEQQSSFAQDIYVAGIKLLDLISNILDFTRLESGYARIELKAVNADGLLNESVMPWRERATGSGLTFMLDIPEPLGILYLDAAKVRQIVVSLLSNAVKFTPTGGSITLTARRVDRLAGDALPDAFAEYLEIRVCDTGIGFSPEMLNRLFDAFHQGDAVLGRHYEGVGLGLALVKSLADLHGGAVQAYNSRNHGACVTVWLPWRGKAA